MSEVRLIDANALKEEVNKKKVVGRFNTLLLIDNAPTVDLKDIYQEGHYDGHLEGYTKAINEERPQGEWVFKDLHNGKIWYECSICGRKIHVGDKVQLSDFPFCHCGADMKGGTEND